MTSSFIDIHCHLLPGIDDGARDWDESLAMARLAVDDGTTTIIATPHQLGNFGHNRGDDIRRLGVELQQRLDAAAISLRVLPGADVRIEPEMIDGLVRGDVLTLGDHRRHVLLELPHDIYLPLEPVLEELARRNIVGVLSHPERNHGLLRRPEVLAPLVNAGCLLQITAGSLCGSFHADCQQFAERLLRDGLVHIVASDGHRPRSRRPLLRRAYDRVAALVDQQTADDLCRLNPARVASGQSVPSGRRDVPRGPSGWWTGRSAA